MFGQPDRVEKPIIVIAGSEEEYMTYLRENRLTPRDAVYVVQGYQLEELHPDCEIVEVGSFWLNAVHGSDELGKYRRRQLKHQDAMAFSNAIPQPDIKPDSESQGVTEMRFGAQSTDSPLMIALKKIVNSSGNVGELKTIAANAIRDNSR